MSVAGILSTAAMSIGAQFFQSRAQQMKQDFRQLGSDLQSGNLTAAQADFATLQKLQPQPPITPSNVPLSSTQTGNSVAQDWSQLAADLKAGNTTAAQQDFTKLQEDAQSQSTQTHHHHHHHAGGDSDSGAISQLFSQLGTALQSGNLSAAQQAYSTMLQDFQRFGATSAPSAGSVSVSA